MKSPICLLKTAKKSEELIDKQKFIVVLLETHFKNVYSIAKSYFPMATDDAVQDIAEHILYIDISKFPSKSEGQLRYFLIKCVVNKLRNIKREKKYAIYLDVTRNQINCRDIKAYYYNNRTMLPIEVDEAINSLPKNQKLVIRLILENFSLYEIVSFTKKSPDAIKKLKFRAIINLRNYLCKAG